MRRDQDALLGDSSTENEDRPTTTGSSNIRSTIRRSSSGSRRVSVFNFPKSSINFDTSNAVHFLKKTYF